jgi:hypothetical protein
VKGVGRHPAFPDTRSENDGDPVFGRNVIGGAEDLAGRVRPDAKIDETDGENGDETEVEQDKEDAAQAFHINFGF